MALIDANNRFSGTYADLQTADAEVFRGIEALVTDPMIEGYSFPDKQKTVLFSGKVAVGSDVVDWKLELPEHLRYPGVVGISPGYLAIENTSRPLREALAQQGVATFSYDPARKDSWWLSMCDPQALHAATQEAIFADLKERTDIKNGPNGDRLDLERRILLAHSMGGFAATMFAKMQPGTIEFIYGCATTGFGHPTIPELTHDIPLGMISGIKHELLPTLFSGNISVNIKTAKEFINYYRHMRVVFEGLSCVFQDTREDVALLSDLGIDYHYEAYEHDILVRADESVADHVKSHKIIPKAGHLHPQKRPERVAERIIALV